mmetsp:Transcript_2581/g.6048  ORF Transcript_2581/g.6048 Transcript_2581/m.6048 type:complete len:457 (-) Transcript_2581:82-1452(-)
MLLHLHCATLLTLVGSSRVHHNVRRAPLLRAHGGDVSARHNYECPLEKPDGPDVEAEEIRTLGGGDGGDCCGNGAQLFNCDLVRISVGDSVKWNSSDADIPEGAVGNVTKVKLPEVMVRFPGGLFRMEFEVLQVVQAAVETEERWFCRCDECVNIERHIYIGNYSVQQQKHLGKVDHLRAWADFTTKASAANGSGFAGQVVFLYPSEDDNNAFAFREQLCSRISCWLQRNYNVTFRVVQSVKHASIILDEFQDRDIHHVIIGGHGTETSIAWKEQEAAKLQVSSPLLKPFLLKLRNKLRLDATVTLDSCRSAGKVRKGSNIWKEIALQLRGRQIKGATTDLKESMWTAPEKAECLAGDTAVFRERGVTKMRVLQSGKPTCSEMLPGDIEEAVSKGSVCLSACRQWCRHALTVLTLRGVVPAKKVSLRNSGLPPESDDCWIGTKRVCRWGGIEPALP